MLLLVRCFVVACAYPKEVPLFTEMPRVDRSPPPKPHRSARLPLSLTKEAHGTAE
jgi:hypothetical protein